METDSPTLTSAAVSERRRVGHVVAMRSEARCLSEGFRGPSRQQAIHDGVLLELAGIGRLRAELAAKALQQAPVQGLVSFGTCGALAPGLAAGSLLLASAVLEASGVRHTVCATWRARLEAALAPAISAHDGLIVEAHSVVETPRDKTRLHRASGAHAVDMESAAVAAVANAAGLPFLVVRVVSDASDTAVPPSALAAVDGDGEVRRWRALVALLRRPLDLPRLLALRHESRAAHATLREIVAAAGPDLCFSGG